MSVTPQPPLLLVAPLLRPCASLMYGSGLRVTECLALRVKDVDLERHEITVRGGEGGKDRRTPLAEYPNAAREWKWSYAFPAGSRVVAGRASLRAPRGAAAFVGASVGRGDASASSQRPRPEVSALRTLCFDLPPHNLALHSDGAPTWCVGTVSGAPHLAAMIMQRA